jgi:uncharacterized protein YbjT (DUF2867 family)
MRIAVAGATGRIGRLTVGTLERDGHQTVPVSRKAGVDAYTGEGLAAALRGADAVIDATNTASADEAEIVDFFGTITRNLLAAGERAGVRHHVLLSIVGIDHNQRVAHYAGKREQERLAPTWRGAFGPDMAGEVLLPGDGARLGPTTFDDWLAAGAR